jgi:proline iminopeptidase
MKHFHLMFAGLVAIGMAVSCGAQAGAPEPQDSQWSRDKVTGIIAAEEKIVSGNGVEELLEIPVGGTRQWISVRGRDRANPVLLMIHGGPASPEMPTRWYFQGGWEDYFTVVQWDQRGAGKTYNANDPQQIKPTLSLQRITQDAAEVVQYLRAKYGKEKIFVLGHSWGSVVGLSLAREHPQWLYAYVGMGQMVSFTEGERDGYEQTIRRARETGNAQAVRELEALAPYPNPDGSVPLDKLGRERQWSVALGGLMWGRASLGAYYALADLSPDYTAADLDAIDKGSALSLGSLLPAMTAFDMSKVTVWRCPIILFAGRHDFTTPSTVVARWYERIHAPQKKLIWFENSAHMIMVEEPGRMLVHLVEDVRPLAR